MYDIHIPIEVYSYPPPPPSKFDQNLQLPIKICRIKICRDSKSNPGLGQHSPTCPPSLPEAA